MLEHCPQLNLTRTQFNTYRAAKDDGTEIVRGRNELHFHAVFDTFMQLLLIVGVQDYHISGNFS